MTHYMLDIKLRDCIDRIIAVIYEHKIWLKQSYQWPFQEQSTHGRTHGHKKSPYNIQYCYLEYHLVLFTYVIMQSR